MSYKKLQDLELAVAYKIKDAYRINEWYGNVTIIEIVIDSRSDSSTDPLSGSSADPRSDSSADNSKTYKIYLPKRYNIIGNIEELKGKYFTYYGMNEIDNYKEHICRIDKFDGCLLYTSPSPRD